MPPRWSDSAPKDLDYQWTNAMFEAFRDDELKAELERRGFKVFTPSQLRTYYCRERLDALALMYLKDPTYIEYAKRAGVKRVANAVADDMATLEVTRGFDHIEMTHSLTVVVPEKPSDDTSFADHAAAVLASYGLRPGVYPERGYDRLP